MDQVWFKSLFHESRIWSAHCPHIGSDSQHGTAGQNYLRRPPATGHGHIASRCSSKSMMVELIISSTPLIASCRSNTSLGQPAATRRRWDTAAATKETRCVRHRLDERREMSMTALTTVLNHGAANLCSSHLSSACGPTCQQRQGVDDYFIPGGETVQFSILLFTNATDEYNICYVILQLYAKPWDLRVQSMRYFL